jgi:hypothetical protein
MGNGYMQIKSFLGKQIDNDLAITSETLIVQSKHKLDHLESLTKKEVIAYAHKYGIAINSRKKKDELIEIILRN